MSFDAALVLLLSLSILLLLRAGAARAVMALIVALAAAAAGIFLTPEAGLAGFALWTVLVLVFAVWGRSGSRATILLPAGLGVLQGGIVVALLPGFLLAGPYADRPEAAQKLRTASVYGPIQALASVLPVDQTASLRYPDPLTVRTEPRNAPVRPIDWATSEPFSGTTIRALPGEVRAAERAPLAFEVEGRIADISVEIGDAFAAGDVLASIDTHLLELALQEREAALIEATARLQEARLAEERQKQLLDRGVVADTIYESAVAALESALSRQRVAQSGIEQAQDRLNDATLRAPYAGSVAARLAEPAQTIRAGEPILEIQSNGGGFEVVTTVPDTLIGQLTIGSEHDIRLLDGSDVTTVAELSEIGARAIGSSGFPVTLSLTTSTGQLRPGVSVEVLLRVQTAAPRDGVVTVPVEAILMGAGQARYVFVFDLDTGVLSRRAVSLLGTEGGLALVSDGLVSDEIVASRGVPFLTDGMAVQLRGAGVARYDN